VQVTECVSVRLVVLFVHHVAQAQCGAASAYETGVLLSCSSTMLRRRNAVRHLPTKLEQMAQQLLQICRKSTSIENESVKTVHEMAALVLLKMNCAGWKAKKQM